MSKILLILMFIFPFCSFAEECELNNSSSEVILMSETITQSAEVLCEKKLDDNYLDLATGCLSGGWKAGKGAIEGFAELVKLLLMDAPSWVWDEASTKIEKLLSSDKDPSEIVESIGDINLASQEEIWAKAQRYWESFINFTSDLKKTLIQEIKGFPCLPLHKQSEIICQGVSNVFLLVLSPTQFIKGAKWGIDTARALKRFADETKLAHGLENASLANRLELAGAALKEVNLTTKEIMTLKDARLFETELPNGEKILQYTKKVKDKDGNTHLITRDVPVDAKTHAIDSNTTIGKEILESMIKEKAGKGSIVFVDVNHLGKTNYFDGGTQAGDRYLGSVSESLNKAMRPGDMLFKNGGDELVVVVANNQAKVVKNISQRMINEVDMNKSIRQIFKHEVKKSVQKYRDLNTAKGLNELPSSLKGSLSPAELELARRDFSTFKESKLKEIKNEFQDQASYRGSISVGSSLIDSTDELPLVLSRAEAQASKVKAEYKSRLGHDVSKYNVEEIPLSTTRKWSPPQALDPK